MRSIMSAGMLAMVLLAKQAIAGPRHGHFHKRAVEVVTDWDVVTDTITDIVWVTVTGDDGATTTTTTPAAVVSVAATTTSVASVAPPASVASSSAAPVVTTAAAPVVTSAAAPVVSSAAPVVEAPVASISSPPAALVTSSSVSISSAPVQTTLSTVASAATTSSAAAAVASSSTSSSSSSSSKRGLSYNDISLLDLFEGSSTIDWCYNWGSSADGTVPSSLEYIPMLWGLESSATSNWLTNAKAAIADGASAVLAFNEPDNPDQSNITPANAAAGYIQYMNPLSGSAQLGAPAVTNGGSPEGLTWLESFITACNGECDIDFVPIHWYDSASNYAYFKEYVQEAYVAGGNRTLWITEFGATGTDAEVVEFLTVVMPWLDEQEYVGRYAYFMDEVGVLAETTTELSEIGSTFMSYTSSIVSSLIADI